MLRRLPAVLVLLLALPLFPAAAQPTPDALRQQANTHIAALEDAVLNWRRHIHQHPELSNQEYQTAAYVAEHLQALGLDVETGVAVTGVVGVLRGGQPGPVVALRADMDALPVTEEVDLPFASKARGTYLGQDVGVMHACGHDAHVAILMGTAEVLARMRDDLPGTVKFIFQPAEEGAPEVDTWGAKQMVEEGVLRTAPVPEVIFGLHVTPRHEVGQIAYRKRGAMAASDVLDITIRGKQTHAAYPWGGIDPIVVASQVVLGLQTVASRQYDITQAPAVVSIGKIEGGVRNNIIPDAVQLVGTIRTLDPAIQDHIHTRVTETAQGIAQSAGATAEVAIRRGYPVTYNDPDLADRMHPTLERVTGGQVLEVPPVLGAEDFSYFQQAIPGLYVWLGVRTPDAPAGLFAANHSPLFRIDEDALPVGLRAMTHLTLDYLTGPGQ